MAVLLKKHSNEIAKILKYEKATDNMIENLSRYFSTLNPKFDENIFRKKSGHSDYQ